MLFLDSHFQLTTTSTPLLASNPVSFIDQIRLVMGNCVRRDNKSEASAALNVFTRSSTSSAPTSKQYVYKNMMNDSLSNLSSNVSDDVEHHSRNPIGYNCSDSLHSMSAPLASAEPSLPSTPAVITSGAPFFNTGITSFQWLSDPPPTPPPPRLSLLQSPIALEQEDALKPKQPRILPIQQDGNQLSHTHYWVLPDRGCPSSKFKTLDKTITTQSSFQTIGGQTNHSIGMSSPEQHYHNLDAIVTHQSEMGFSSNHSASTKHKKSKNTSNDCAAASPRENVLHLTNTVHGVTEDEAYAALIHCSWNMETAICFLKTEQLFRLGLTTREKCEIFLKCNDWNLESAGTALIFANK